MPQDYNEAFKLVRQAADQSYAAAQSTLGWMYAQGKGVAQNDAEAIKWFTKAANQNYADAQNNLGLMYEKGQGVPQMMPPLRIGFARRLNATLAAPRTTWP